MKMIGSRIPDCYCQIHYLQGNDEGSDVDYNECTSTGEPGNNNSRLYTGLAGEEEDAFVEKCLYTWSNKCLRKDGDTRLDIGSGTKSHTSGNWQGKVSNVISVHVITMMNLWNVLFSSGRKQSRVHLNTMCPSFSVRVFVVLVCLVLILQSLPSADASEPLGNPYKILGVSRHATQKDIRKSYKNLVKEWHPDKTDHPAAESKFVEITKAYELLSDPERRRKFDNHGITEEGIPRYKREEGHFNMHDPFEEFFSGNFKFHYQSRDISLFHKMSITFRAYENNLLPKSHRTPYLILLYSDWCFSCLQIEPTWQRLIEELEPLGVNLVTVDAGRESALARKLSVHSLPCLAVTINGKTSMFKESVFSVQKIVEFLRSKFPYKLINNINNNNVDGFLSGWSDNKIRALIFENRETPRLRYLIVALHHRDRVVFGFVQTGIESTAEITSKYKISEDMDTLLLFNENLETPMASISMHDIPSDTMHNVIGSNKFLILPRLSNQAMLDSVCPQEWQRVQKRLCAILVSQNTPELDTTRNKFRQAALVSPYSQERVRYAYVFKEMQPQFISALSAGEGSPSDPLHHIVIIWRRDSSHVKYDWFSSEWTTENIDDNQWNETRLSLEQTIQRLLRSTEALPYAATIQELTDEHALSILERIVNKVIMAGDYLADNLSKEQVLPLLSVLATLLLLVAVGYGMSYLAKLEEAKVQAKYGQFKDSVRSVTATPQLKLHEMRAETFNGLVRFLKPGCRTIVLLVDAQSKLKLLPSFHKAVWPYRKNKTLMFCHLSLERGLEWYKKILQLSLPEPRELNINAKNCVGTVLSLAGHRKYFCMYHAKHPENSKGKSNRRMERMTKRLAQPDDAEAGAFIGFDSSSDSEASHDDTHDDILYQDKLLDGLPMWLDRLFEGSTQRYYINYWPDFTAK
ncbi:dnaJ homolog subfamily C member 16 [Copidosoma floridanum]|uniref:dnaJ homolog subfamily C member 16 n=1 Tax=Copidosoma floridanum TaxID=29053 RepID=UPI0006C96972|nr:dnaJ homolog subfamily C member 16 [Copidosoma floridanum]